VLERGEAQRYLAANRSTTRANCLRFEVEAWLHDESAERIDWSI
jgi:hypothetical protein